MAVQGIGITRLPLFTCEQEVVNGELKVILEDHEQLELDIYAVNPHRQCLIAKVRAFIDFLVNSFKNPSRLPNYIVSNRISPLSSGTYVFLLSC